MFFARISASCSSLVLENEWSDNEKTVQLIKVEFSDEDESQSLRSTPHKDEHEDDLVAAALRPLVGLFHKTAQ